MKKMIMVAEGLLFWIAFLVMIMEQGDSTLAFFVFTKIFAVGGFLLLIRLDAYRVRLEKVENKKRRRN